MRFGSGTVRIPEALAASPNDQAAYMQEAYTYFPKRVGQADLKKDPRPEIALLIKTGQRAIELNPQMRW